MKVLFIFLMVAIANGLVAQNTIKDARQQNVGSTVTVSGIVINGDEMGAIRYLQDNTAGIAVYDNALSTVKRGDSITVTGKLVDYNNLLEISSITTVTTHSSDNQLPAAKTLSIDEIGENYEGQLIKINNVELEKAGSEFSGGLNYDFTNGTKTGVFRINNGSPIVGEIIPSGEITLVAICSQYSYNSNETKEGYQLLPRNMDDFISESSIKITSPVEVSGITKNSIILNWGTNSGTNPFVRYGIAYDVNSLTNYKAGNSTTDGENQLNSVEITGLQASEIVYAQVFSTLGSDTVFSSINAYATESNSSGQTNVYFNSPIAAMQATETEAKNIGTAMEDTLAVYINNAKESIDFCIYNFGNTTISNALNAAHDRGVKIRLITCGSTSHTSIGDLKSGIPVSERPEISEGGIMHNKFAVIDGNSSDANEPWLWSGSTNLTSAQLYVDANNMVFIQDQSLAKTYQIEFEEMWGSTGDQPNASNARFGDKKTDNTPHEFIINGNRVECYFSPSDNTNQKLIDAIETADKNLDVQTMLITRSDIANAIIAAQTRGVEVNVITDDENDNTTTVNSILQDLPANKFIFDDNVNGTLHHKMAIIDAKDTSSDPQVINGSHNWSNAANDKNDENTLIIHDADISNQFYQQFAYRFEQNDGNLILSAKTIEIESLKIYPNPTENRIYISTNEVLQNVRLYSIRGTLVQQFTPESNTTAELDLSKQKSGIYILKVETANKQTNTYKIIKK